MIASICKFLIAFVIDQNDTLSINMKQYLPVSCEQQEIVIDNETIPIRECLYNVSDKFTITVHTRLDTNESNMFVYVSKTDKLYDLECEPTNTY